MLKETLSEIITGKPDTIQFAKDRKYEQSWITPRSKNRPSAQEISDYLGREPFKLLIVEYIWNSPEDARRFVLTVFLDKTCALQNPQILMTTCLGLFYDYTDFASFTGLFDNQIIGRPYLFTVPIEIVNMSVFNHWLSVGPVELWQTGDVYFKRAKTLAVRPGMKRYQQTPQAPERNEETTRRQPVVFHNQKLAAEKIKARPEIEKTTLNYQGLFFRFNVSGKYAGPHFGLKTPCCRKENDVWVVDYKMVDYWMRLMLLN